MCYLSKNAIIFSCLLPVGNFALHLVIAVTTQIKKIHRKIRSTQIIYGRIHRKIRSTQIIYGRIYIVKILCFITVTTDIEKKVIYIRSNLAPPMDRKCHIFDLVNNLKVLFISLRFSLNEIARHFTKGN